MVDYLGRGADATLALALFHVFGDANLEEKSEHEIASHQILQPEARAA